MVAPSALMHLIRPKTDRRQPAWKRPTGAMPRSRPEIGSGPSGARQRTWARTDPVAHIWLWLAAWRGGETEDPDR